MTTIDAYVSELGRAVHGPARVRRSMLREVHDGLVDAVEAYEESGLDPDTAQARAVADFGSVAELAELYRAELTARRGRVTALYVAIVFPAMMLGWDLLWRAGMTWGPPPGPEQVERVRSLATLVDIVTVAATGAALTLFGLTFLRSAPPRVLTALAGVTAAVGALGTGGLSVWMNVAWMNVAWMDVVSMTVVGDPATATADSTPGPAMLAYSVSGALLLATLGVAAGALRTAISGDPARSRRGRPRSAPADATGYR